MGKPCRATHGLIAALGWRGQARAGCSGKGDDERYTRLAVGANRRVNMSKQDLSALDRAIQTTRESTATALADVFGVSRETVLERMGRLEAEQWIRDNTKPVNDQPFTMYFSVAPIGP